MNRESLRAHCLAKPGVTEELPFGPEVLVYKVSGKMFLLVPLSDGPLQFNAKCDPERALDLRAEYPSVTAGYHMNKKHWNTIRVDGRVPDARLREWIDDSWELVVSGLSRAERRKLGRG